MRGAGNVPFTVGIGNVYKILIENPEGKTLLGRPRHKFEGSY